MKYRIVFTLYIVLVQGQVNGNFRLVLNEMGPGRTSRAWYFHSPALKPLVRIETIGRNGHKVTYKSSYKKNDSSKTLCPMVLAGYLCKKDLL